MSNTTAECPACEAHPLGTCEACLKATFPEQHKFHDQDTKVIPQAEIERVQKEAELNAAEILSKGK